MSLRVEYTENAHQITVIKTFTLSGVDHGGRGQVRQNMESSGYSWTLTTMLLEFLLVLCIWYRGINYIAR